MSDPTQSPAAAPEAATPASGDMQAVAEAQAQVAAAPATTDLREAAQDVEAASSMISGAADDVGQAAVEISAEAHEEAKGVLESIVSKLENFEHALAADAKAELEKLKTLLHL